MVEGKFASIPDSRRRQLMPASLRVLGRPRCRTDRGQCPQPAPAIPQYHNRAQPNGTVAEVLIPEPDDLLDLPTEQLRVCSSSTSTVTMVSRNTRPRRRIRVLCRYNR